MMKKFAKKAGTVQGSAVKLNILDWDGSKESKVLEFSLKEHKPNLKVSFLSFHLVFSVFMNAVYSSRNKI